MDKIYFVELTDLFCGELNYSYVSRYHIKSVSMRGAMSRLSRVTGLNFRLYNDYGDGAIYHSKSKLTGVYVDELDMSVMQDYHAKRIGY